MELYRLGIACLPSRFYRVQCSKSQTIHDETGLSAPSELLTNLTEDESRYLMAEAFTWGSHITSPIIKVFSERVHAVNWALKWLNSEDERCKLLTIKTCELGDVTVSKVSTLVDKLGVNLPYGASRHKKGSHLCLNRTPARAVCPCESLSSIRAGEVLRNMTAYC